MKLLGSLTSPYVRKVRIVMAEKKLDFQLVLEDPWAGDEVLKSNPQWKLTSDEMKQRDARDGKSSDGRPGHFATLLAAQRAWLKYRDAQCDLEGYQFRGGTMEPLLVATCRAGLTEARTKQLKDLIEQ